MDRGQRDSAALKLPEFGKQEPQFDPVDATHKLLVLPVCMEPPPVGVRTPTVNMDTMLAQSKVPGETLRFAYWAKPLSGCVDRAVEEMMDELSVLKGLPISSQVGFTSVSI